MILEKSTLPTIRGISRFTTSHFGGWVNLEGDIGGYLVGKNPNSTFSAPGLALEYNDYIADALEAYLINDGNGDWSDRAEIFLKMVAGQNVDEKTVDNLSEKIEDFAENYLLVRAFDDEDIDMYEASAHLKGASREMAKIFIHSLQNAENRVQGTLDINPSPKGEPYIKYKLGRKVLELKDKIKDWIKN